MADAPPAWMKRAFGLLGRGAPVLAARLAAELLTRPRGRNPAQPWELEPFTPAVQHVVLPGRVRALRWGDEGPVVLAQHGWRGRPTQFGRLAEAIVPRGLSLVAIDAPGHGHSPGPRATPRLLADTLVGAAAALGEIQAVVGHSLGGAAAAIALARGLATQRLVMIGSPTRPSRLIAHHADQLGLPPAARAALDGWFDAHAGCPAAQLDPVALRLDPRVAALVIHDRDDDIIPVGEAELLQRAWPAARFLYTAGLGHRDVVSDPRVVAEVAEFLLAPAAAAAA